jgi:hypothetical protein
MCPGCKVYGLCITCEKKTVCFICRESLDGYDAAKDPRCGSETKQRAMCTLHQKERGITNLISNGDGTYKCRDAQPCTVTGTGKGKEKGKEKVKGKKTETKAHSS